MLFFKPQNNQYFVLKNHVIPLIIAFSIMLQRNCKFTLFYRHSSVRKSLTFTKH